MTILKIGCFLTPVSLIARFMQNYLFFLLNLNAPYPFDHIISFFGIIIYDLIPAFYLNKLFTVDFIDRKASSILERGFSSYEVEKKPSVRS